MDGLLIQGINMGELETLIQGAISAAVPKPISPNDQIVHCLIDRPFIRRNLRISLRAIMKYEDKGVLKRVLYLADAKGVFYRLSDYIELYRIEQAKLRPHV